ncbi:MAG: aspartate--tRNA(Asn) ligase [Nanoarchaeota archaeon]|nr:aspartate--tRNA(Asn) ligase [Nanoarchaeota archaeon]MBU1643575.1 aspartate--tRNA(Asn) ligase [Nanoarchaeota archaeon]MBU1977171.1 aspartate--tRNA(Asn) ligase [Nanoarchaeota archaeon]
MLRTHTCGELSKKEAGQKVTLSGWVDSVRISGKIGFLDLRDRSGKTQVFLNKDLAHEFRNLNKEDVLQISGEVKARPESQVKEAGTGEIELSAQEIKVISPAETPLPVDVTEESTTKLDKRMDYRFLDVRREKIKDIFTIRSKIYSTTVKFFEQEKFINIQTPKLTASGVESGAEEFKINYFGKTAALAQSPQVYKQMFVVSGLEKVYEIAPIFRAEKSHTTRHLTEFTGVDFEMGFIEDENDVMDVIEKYFIFLLSELKVSCKEEFKRLGVTVNVPKKIPKYSLPEARKMLKVKGKIIPEDDDLDAEAEKMVGEFIKEKYQCDFVFMLDYPWKKRAFYHMRPDNNKNVTKSFDLLFNGVEIATGAQREHRLDILKAQALEKGVDIEKMQFYRDIFRYGCPPHGGVGFGLDRITAQILNLDNVREAILLPRDPERLTP